MRKVIIATVMSAVLSSVTFAGEPAMGKFIGLWELDVGRTTAEIQKIAKDNRSQLDTMFGKMSVEEMLVQVKGMASAMKYQITTKDTYAKHFRKQVTIRLGVDVIE